MSTGTSPKRQPRDYQLQAIANFFEARARGIRRMLLVLATGCGKTMTFSTLINQLIVEEGARILVIAHREELISQAVKSISEFVPRGQIGIVKARQRETHYPVVVASVQSIATEKQRANLPKFDLIVIDEAHRSLARSYRAVMANLLSEKGCVLGVTATPQRADGGALAEVFEEIIFQMGLKEAIEKGWLCHLIARRVTLSADFSGLKLKSTTEGEKDFDAKEVCGAMDAVNWKKEVTEAWITHARERKTIGFLPSVAFAHQLAEYMQAQGVRAVAIDGTTDKHERRRVIESFGKDVQVLLNCALLVEGVDLPDADCCLSAAMTASLGRYMQSIGRVTRKAAGKENALILDVVGVSGKNRICEAFSLGAIKFCLECQVQSTLQYHQVGKDYDGEPVHVCAHCYDALECNDCHIRHASRYHVTNLFKSDQHYLCPVCKPKGEARERAAKDKEQMDVLLAYNSVDLLAEAIKGDPKHSRFQQYHQRRVGPYAWEVEGPEGAMNLRTEAVIFAIVPRRDEHGIYYEYFDNQVGSGFYGRAGTRMNAIRIIEEEVLRAIEAAPGHVAPSQKQIDFLIRLGINFPANITKQAASQLITARLHR